MKKRKNFIYITTCNRPLNTVGELIETICKHFPKDEDFEIVLSHDGVDKPVHIYESIFPENLPKVSFHLNTQEQEDYINKNKHRMKHPSRYRCLFNSMKAFKHMFEKSDFENDMFWYFEDDVIILEPSTYFKNIFENKLYSEIRNMTLIGSPDYHDPNDKNLIHKVRFINGFVGLFAFTFKLDFNNRNVLLKQLIKNEQLENPHPADWACWLFKDITWKTSLITIKHLNNNSTNNLSNL